MFINFINTFLLGHTFVLFIEYNERMEITHHQGNQRTTSPYPERDGFPCPTAL